MKLAVFLVFCTVMALDMVYIGYKETLTAIVLFVAIKNLFERG